MATIEQLIKKLDGVQVLTAGTGSIYVYYNGLKVRIADHEPNYSAPNRHNDKCFYLKDACNNKYDIYDVIEAVAEYLQIEIHGTLKGMITKHRNKEINLQLEICKYQKEQEKKEAEFAKERERRYDMLTSIINGNKNEIKRMLIEAEEYGYLGSNGDKRRKRTRNYFKRLFVEKFGLDPDFSLVKEIVYK